MSVKSYQLVLLKFNEIKSLIHLRKFFIELIGQPVLFYRFHLKKSIANVVTVLNADSLVNLSTVTKKNWLN